MPGLVWSGGDLREVALSGVDGGRPSLSRWIMEAPLGQIGLSMPVPTTYEMIWRTQPAVRTVVHYLARNMAQLGLQVFQGTDQGRTRVRAQDHPFADTIGNPHPGTTQYRLIEDLISDLALYGRAYWLKQWDSGGVMRLLRLMPRFVQAADGDIVNGVTAFWFSGPQGRTLIPADQLVWFRGYSPDWVGGESPIEALRQTLYEDWVAYQFRNDMWQRGARIGGVIERPETAPDWSPTARDRFRQDWQQRYGGQGTEAGGTPVLEDGMSFKQMQAFSPEQAQFLETHSIAGQTVAAAYQVPAALVVAGASSANFAVVRELHQSVYQDTLGPWAAQLESEIILQIGPDYDLPSDMYLEFNISEKLQGSFDQTAASLMSAVGGPWMTRAEARQRMNLTYLGPETDELITPLNVEVGGLAAPNDTAPGQGNGAGPGRATRRRAALPAAKATVTATSTIQQRQAALEDAMSAFLASQGQEMTTALQAGKQLAEVWASGQWTDEMADLILEHTLGIAKTAADSLLADLESTVDFRTDPMRAYLTVSAQGAAQAVQNRAYASLADAVGGPGSAADQAADIFGGFQTGNLAQTLTTEATGLGSHDAAIAAGCTLKTWNVTSANPRSSHSGMDGETVPVGQVFSNGARWPGDRQLTEGERDGCTCSLSYQREQNP